MTATMMEESERRERKSILETIPSKNLKKLSKLEKFAKFEKLGRTVALFAASIVTFVTSTEVARAAEEISCKEEFGGADPNTVFIVACVAEFLALTGAAVGGILARQRKQEVELINAQLRQINISLRKQARVESYAPSLTYAPVGATSVASRTTGTATAVRESEVSESPPTEKDEAIRLLKAGKRCLREQNPREAVVKFEAALKLAKKVGDKVEEKKAARGLGASYQRQKMYKEAIKYHQMVLEVSKVSGESSGDTEAFGAIADCYTELGDLECAAKYYDRYISRLNHANELDNQE